MSEQAAPSEQVDLSGRVALVTGAARGIGQAICVRLARAGATVVGVDLLDQTRTGELVSAHAAWAAHRVDLTDPAAVTRAVDDVAAAHGRLDIVVNNAGIDDAVGVDELDLARFRQVLLVDLEAPFVIVKAALPHMRHHGFGRIVNIGSGSVLNPMRGFVAYRAAKLGLVGMTRALSTELGVDGITANVVSPGVTAGVMVDESLTPAFLAATLERQGVKRTGHPEDIAEAVCFLASPAAAFVTGQTLLVNGGAAFS